MSLALCRLLWVLCLGAAGIALSAEPPPDERDRIETERAAIEATWLARERECATRFAVTACVESAQRVRRSGLADLRRREVVLDDALRRERAAARVENLETKSLERPTPAPRVREPRAPKPASPREPRPAREAPVKAASGAASSAAMSVPAAGAQAEPRARARSAPVDRRQQDAARAAAFAERTEAARVHREAVERRNAERAAKGKQGRPLPVGAGASAP